MPLPRWSACPLSQRGNAQRSPRTLEATRVALKQRIDSMNLRRQPLLGLLLARASESNVDRYAAMFLVDYQPAVAIGCRAFESAP